MFWLITGTVFALFVGALWLYERKKGRRYRVDDSHLGIERGQAEYQAIRHRQFWGPMGGAGGQ